MNARRARHLACALIWLSLCRAAAAEILQLEPGPDLQPHLLPRVYLSVESSEGLPPLMLVNQVGGAQPESSGVVGPPAMHEGVPDGMGLVEPSHAGCGCPGCQAGAGHAFPGYDGLDYSLHGGCPPVVISEEWCRRPFFFDVFIGGLWGDEFVDGQIDQEASLLIGGRLGWDLSGAWGVETRLAWSEVGIENLAGPPQNRQADLLLWDVSLVHYFGSNLKLRPFCSIGLGLVDWEYVDINGNAEDEKIAGVPIALGLKRRVDDWLVLRLEATDNIAFGGGTPLGTQHNFSLTGNVEIRFGGPRTSYWAWGKRKHYAW